MTPPSFSAPSRFRRAAAAALCSLVLLTGCTTHPTPPGGNYTDGTHDPLEGFNRGMFKVNAVVDSHAIEPVIKGYDNYVPTPVHTGLRNFLHNLRTPINAANNLLEGNFKGAGTDVARFALNTTVGVGGLVDVAGANGLAYHEKDFGQTLGVWGVGPGPFLVLPLLGPSDIRDTTGLIVDGVADPIDIYLATTDVSWLIYVRGGLVYLDTRDELQPALEDLRRNSIDVYAATRSAYLQERQAQIRRDNPHKNAAAATLPSTDHP